MDSKVARAASKIIRVMVVVRSKKFLRPGVNCGMAMACRMPGMHIHGAPDADLRVAVMGNRDRLKPAFRVNTSTDVRNS